MLFKIWNMNNDSFRAGVVNPIPTTHTSKFYSGLSEKLLILLWHSFLLVYVHIK